jgi:hypothetical protein
LKKREAFLELIALDGGISEPYFRVGLCADWFKAGSQLSHATNLAVYRGRDIVNDEIGFRRVRSSRRAVRLRLRVCKQTPLHGRFGDLFLAS